MMLVLSEIVLMPQASNEEFRKMVLVKFALTGRDSLASESIFDRSLAVAIHAGDVV